MLKCNFNKSLFKKNKYKRAFLKLIRISNMKFQGRKVSESRGYNLMFFLDDVNQFRVSSVKKYKSFKDLNNFM